MRDHSAHIELTREEAVATMLAHCAFHPETEEVPLEEAFGRTLAGDVCSLVTVPNCLTCNMDSVALRWRDFENGTPDISGWQRGVQWQFANTGIGMPEGFDCAVAIENAVVSADDTRLEEILLAPSRQFAGTRPAGSALREGDPVAARGTVVTPEIAAALAGAGYTRARVISRPRVAFIPTGNELVHAGGEIPRGKNIESNSLVVAGKVRAWDGIPIVYDIVADDPAAIEQALRTACAEADIVVLNAGSSKGSDDWAMELLEKIGQVFNHETNHGPGHHSSYALVEGTPIVGISGPSLGAAFTTDFYLKPLIDTWYGHTPEPQRITVRLAAPFDHGSPAPRAADAPAPGGEERPHGVHVKPFFGIGFVMLAEAPDGVFEATPLLGRPSLAAFNACAAYYPVDRTDPPQVGDMIEVELRP